MEYNTLLKAAREGDTFKLQELLEKDPLLLDSIMLMPLFTETPLHAAALAGNSEFVKQLLRVAPWLATQHSNRHGVNALHIAAARGNVDVVTALLDFNNELDLTFDGEGCGPLHYAACHGRSDVVKLLVSRNVSLLKQVNFLGESAVHVAVKSNQHEVLKVMEEMLYNLGNDEFCQDVLMHVKDEFGHSVVDLLFVSPYKGNNLFQEYANKTCKNGDEVDSKKHRLAKFLTETQTIQLKTKDETDNFLRQVILVIMVLIATVTFQALIAPPQSLWKDGGLRPKDYDPRENTRAHQFLSFLVWNTTAFLISCWGLVAVFQRSELQMIFYWLATCLLAVLTSYYYVLRAMIDDDIFYLFESYFLILLCIYLVTSVAVYSRTFHKGWSKLRQLWQRFVNGHTEIVENGANTNSMVAMSSRTSGINSVV